MADDSISEGTQQSGLRKWAPLIFMVGLMLFIFGVVLPQFIDYEAVFRAIGKINAPGGGLIIEIHLPG